MYSLKTIISSFCIALVFLGCNTTHNSSEKNTTKYTIKNEVSFEKFHTFSENGSYYFNFSPASLEASLGVKVNPDKDGVYKDYK